MFDGIFRRLFGSANDRYIKSLTPLVEQINDHEAELEKLSDEALRGRTAEFRQRLNDGAELDDLLTEAFATVREAARRTLGQRHFDVQLMGGIVLHRGMIAEMKTGEGKTLVSTLPVYLNALTGQGVHVVTVNDYLAKRDAEWMGQIYRFLGMTVGCVVHELDDYERQQAYLCDITYGTNNEFGFDYLRDNMKFRLEEMVQRPFHYAIVDEVNSILIDEARTPLIISGPTEDNSELYLQVDKVIPALEPEDYEKDEKQKTVSLTEPGQEKIETLLRQHGLLTAGGMYDIHNVSLVHHVNQALRAHKLFERDTEYIVRDDKIVIIDEFTGRMMEGRRYSEGLHQALEAKEGVTVQNENQTLASITFQNYFRMYPKLAGMTGTAMTEAEEFGDIYKLEAIEVPTNEPLRRVDNDDEVYRSTREKFDAIAQQVLECRRRRQPILVGTVSIEKSEALSALFKQQKIPHNVLNARFHEQEAFIIAQAGVPGTVTIATNMAGRGTDIQLGGNLEMRVRSEVAALRGADEDRINRVIAALRLNTPVNPGEDDEVWCAAVALRSEIAAAREIVLRQEVRLRQIVVAGEAEAKKLIAQLKKEADFAALATQHSLDKTHPGGDLGYKTRDELDPAIVDIALDLPVGDHCKMPIQTAGGWTVIKVEDRHYGGLFVLGSERHESRRIDNQLRGRSGRQGDPGASKFFVSLEDDLMRIFGSDRMDGLLQRLGLKEGEAIIHRWVNKALEKAQQKVEARNYDIRKQLLKYDDVMNDQRKVVYEQRREIMSSRNVAPTIADMRGDTIADIVARAIPDNALAEQWDADGLRIECQRLLGIDLPIADWTREEGIDSETIEERITAAADRKMAEKAANVGSDLMRMAEKTLLLQFLDHIWKEHLLQLDHLRQGIQLRAYGQRDPLNEYKREAFELFETMLVALREQITSALSHVEFAPPPPDGDPFGMEPPPPAPPQPPLEPFGSDLPRGPSPFDGLSYSETIPMEFEDAMVTADALAPERGTNGSARNRAARRQTRGNGAAAPRRSESSAERGGATAAAAARAPWAGTGRNAPCPCGSGKKFKHCHGRI